MTLFWFWSHRDQVDFSLNKLYKTISITKQSMHQWIDRQLACENEWGQLVPLIEDIRQEHPLMGARTLYHKIQPVNMGRDRFIELCMCNGFRLTVKRNPMRTTNSLGVTKFPNLILGLSVRRINQVWVSDITYYLIGDRFYYITLIMDLKSRFIVGHYVSKTLLTEDTTIPALKIALKKYNPPPGLIMHSDAGGQYFCKMFLELTRKAKIRNSMTEDTGQNNHAERINGTIKNQYLSGYMPTDFNQLVRQTERAVHNYNFGKPHSKLNRATPSMKYAISTTL